MYKLSRDCPAEACSDHPLSCLCLQCPFVFAIVVIVVVVVVPVFGKLRMVSVWKQGRHHRWSDMSTMAPGHIRTNGSVPCLCCGATGNKLLPCILVFFFFVVGQVSVDQRQKTTSHTTGFHLVGWNKTTMTNRHTSGEAGISSCYNEHQEGFVFRGREYFDLELGNGNNRNNLSQ